MGTDFLEYTRAQHVPSSSTTDQGANGCMQNAKARSWAEQPVTGGTAALTHHLEQITTACRWKVPTGTSWDPALKAVSTALSAKTRRSAPLAGVGHTSQVVLLQRGTHGAVHVLSSITNSPNSFPTHKQSQWQAINGLKMQKKIRMQDAWHRLFAVWGSSQGLKQPRTRDIALT